MPNKLTAFVACVGFFCSVIAARPQALDVIGVTALRAATTNVNGTGIRVGQAEVYNGDNGSPNAWEVNPTNVSQPVALFTWHSGTSTSGIYTNSLGTWSSHADAVANNFYGAVIGLATNAAHVDNYDANFLFSESIVTNAGVSTNYIVNFIGQNPADQVVNSSFIFGYVPADVPVAEQQGIDLCYDNYMATNRTLFVSAVGNGGTVCPPGTCYNGIGVGVNNGGSSYGPTVDNGRCKPDLVTPGYPGGYTSFSTPYVSGAAAVLMQAALRGDGGGDTNSASDLRVIKSLLLNGAVKSLDWTNSNASPLDARYGAGVLNVLNSYEQLAGGKRSAIVSNTVALNAAHPPTGAAGTVSVLSGWNFATNTSSATNDTVHHYFFNVSNSVAAAKFSAAATLVWHRHNGKTNINNLNLFLYNCANSNLVLCSTSLVNNVEHLWATNLMQGRYDLQVWKAGGTVVTTNEYYALAWEFVSPTLAISSGANPALTWPLYPAGFFVEARTNLIVGAWSANGLPAAIITNGVNRLPLTATNAAQFFRLRKPNF